VIETRRADFDDCWNRIGVRGDSSCERLVEYVRCANCPVFETAAAKLLEQPIPLVDLSRHDIGSPARHQQAVQGPSESFLVFRIGDEWLALPTPIFKRIVQTRPIHTLPHRQHRAVLGVVNVQGELLVCMSLAHLLGFEAAAAARDDRASRSAASAGGFARRRTRGVSRRPGRWGASFRFGHLLRAARNPVESGRCAYARGRALARHERRTTRRRRAL
jgi:hypothetical protein